MRLGAHVSVAGSLVQGAERARAMGCECLQIFVGNPRQWRAIRHGAADRAAFRARLAEGAMAPLVAHSAYLVNLASSRPALRKKSVSSLVAALRDVEGLGGFGVVTHVGSAGAGTREEGIERVARSLVEALERTSRARILLENSAGGTLGSDFRELSALLDRVERHERVGICLDTAHLFGAGFDLRTARDVRRVLGDFERAVGLQCLWLVHLNDSKAELGSRLDRHENIGEGKIGREGFRALLRTRALAAVAGVLEVPGFDGEGPDRRNLEILRELAAPPRRRPSAAPGAARSLRAVS